MILYRCTRRDGSIEIRSECDSVIWHTVERIEISDQSTINYLHAQEIEPGTFVYEAAGCWIAFPIEALIAFADDPRSEPWLTDPRFVKLPKWWKPDARTVCSRCKHPLCDGFHTTTAGADHYAFVTVNLATGEEIRA